jgi:16S rRNA (guanine527-N7)-methyltransferase
MEDEPAAAGSVFGVRLDLARRFAAWLCGAGVERGLIGPREAERIWTRHLLNCGVVGALLPANAAVVDVGSGAGLPGIPLAIGRPDGRFALVEPLERRCVFLREVIEDLGLTNISVVRGRADEVVDRCGGADVVTSRAVAPLAKLAAWSVPLARRGGAVIAMKGASALDEVERDRAAMTRVGLVDVTVEAVGGELVDPATIVVRGRVNSPAVGRRRR